MNWMKERTLTLFVRLKTLCDVKHTINPIKQKASSV